MELVLDQKAYLEEINRSLRYVSYGQSISSRETSSDIDFHDQHTDDVVLTFWEISLSLKRNKKKVDKKGENQKRGNSKWGNAKRLFGKVIPVTKRATQQYKTILLK